MSLRLRPMTDEEVSSWIDASREAYVIERKNSGEPEETARRNAVDQYTVYFPGGHPAPGHQLMILEDNGARIGGVWIGPHPRRPDASEAAWLYKIEIEEDLRGRGFGRTGLGLIETHLAQSGVTELGLNVFGSNGTARRLYATAGYRDTAVNMVKTLSIPES
jgi:ribosomal protein S18 acetylase RimI-like enzyme